MDASPSEVDKKKEPAEVRRGDRLQTSMMKRVELKANWDGSLEQPTCRPGLAYHKDGTSVGKDGFFRTGHWGK